ncbi:MAG: tetratricopeptide repeat protein [Vicingaceae bacterium]
MRKIFFFGFVLLLFYSCSSTKETTAPVTERKELNEKDKVAFGRTYIDGTKEKILGNYEKSAIYFKKALSIDPYSAAANYELGIVYSSLGEKELAYLQFEMAKEIDPENYWYKISYATALESQGKIDQSIEVFKELVEENPTQLELKYELSKLLLGVGKNKEGIKYLNQIEKDIGVSEEISFLKQRIYLSENNVDAAAEEIKQLIESNPTEIRYYGILADIYLSNDKNEKAIEVYKKMQELDPENYLVQFSLAEYYRSSGEQEKYWESIQKAFANPNMSIDDKVKYLLTFYQIGTNEKAKKEEAIQLCEQIVEAHPKNAKSYALYADFLYFDSQDSAAKEAYQKTIELDSSRFPVWNQLLVILSETNDIDGLLNYGQRAVNLFPNQPSVYLMYGLGLAQEKKYEKAINYYKLGADLTIDNRALKSQFYSSIGDAYHELNKPSESDKFFDKALDLDPNNVFVLNNYSYYLSLRKENLEKAKKMSAKSNNLAPNQASFQDTYAWILYQLEDYEAANEWIDKAIKSDGNISGVLLEHKGDILLKLNQREEAIEFWKKAIDAGGASEKELKIKIEENKKDE